MAPVPLRRNHARSPMTWLQRLRPDRNPHGAGISLVSRHLRQSTTSRRRLQVHGHAFPPNDLSGLRRSSASLFQLGLEPLDDGLIDYRLSAQPGHQPHHRFVRQGIDGDSAIWAKRLDLATACAMPRLIGLHNDFTFRTLDQHQMYPFHGDSS